MTLRATENLRRGAAIAGVDPPARFSIVIPTYNRRHLIAGAIESVLEQNAAIAEVLVVDDGSSDGTGRWISETYRDRPVRYLRNVRRKGPGGARNTGILAAEGDLVAFLDSDDRFLPGHLAECESLLSRRPDIDLVFGRALYERDGRVEDYMGPNFDRKLELAPKAWADENASVFASGFFDDLLQSGCWFNLSTVVLRREAARELMNEGLRIGEDYEFWVRLARTRRFACLHRPQIRYALHDENISFAAAKTAADNAPDLLRALEAIRAYPGIECASMAIIDAQRASILFDWAYRCALRGEMREALRMHCASMRLGKRCANLMAILKIPATALRGTSRGIAQ